MNEENLSGAFTHEQEQWEFWLQSDPDYRRWLDSLEAVRDDECEESDHAQSNSHSH